MCYVKVDVKRNKIRDVDLLERIIAYIMANIGTAFSAASIVKFLKSEYRTISAYTIKREFDIYDEIRDNFPEYVVSMDEIDMRRNDIKHVNIRNFLKADIWS